MDAETRVDPGALREQIKDKYREVAVEPDKEFHFHTGRPAAARLGYDPAMVDPMPDAAVESFAGVANPFSLAQITAGEKIVEAGSGAGFDSFIAAAKTDAQKVELYTASRLTISPDSRAERGYLDLLAGRLGLPDALVDHVEATIRGATAEGAPA